jgi:hypothetical protein
VDYSFLQTGSSVRITRSHLLLLAALTLGTMLWGWFLISGHTISAAERYLVLLGIYGAGSAAFLFFRLRESPLNFFDLPVFLTVLMFVEFGLAPLECFIDPTRLDYGFAGQFQFLPKTLPLIMAGLVAFWLGCIVTGRRKRIWGILPDGGSHVRSARMHIRILGSILALYAVSLATRIYLLTHHMYSYLGSNVLYWHNLALTQVLMVASNFGTYALVMAGIERYLQPSDRKWKCLFWTILLWECAWGLVSGMKVLLLQNFLIVAVISSLIQRKFSKGWVITAVLGAIVLYPISIQYRNLVRTEHQQVTSFTGAVRAQTLAISRASNDAASAATELQSGFRDTVSRLDLLQSVGLILALGPRASDLLGRERWWMLPFYPFIPRFLWLSKPTLLEGARFSIALGFGRMNSTARTIGTSTAVTYPGDLYIRGGVSGIVFGMICLGVVAQWLTSTVSGELDRRSLFLYAAIFLSATSMEIDAFSFWSGLIKSFVILTLIGWFAYGEPRRRLSAGLPVRKAFART